MHSRYPPLSPSGGREPGGVGAEGPEQSPNSSRTEGGFSRNQSRAFISCKDRWVGIQHG